MKFEVKAMEVKEDLSIYLSAGCNKINPLEIEKDLEMMKNYLINKYHKKEENQTFFEYIKNLLK